MHVRGNLRISGAGRLSLDVWKAHAMNRRGFLTGILALGMAPAIVRADSLMRIIPREAVLLTGKIGYFECTTFTYSRNELGEIIEHTRRAHLPSDAGNYYAIMHPDSAALARELLGYPAAKFRRFAGLA